ADEGCNARFPNLAVEFRELLARLDKEPVTVASPYASDTGGGAATEPGKFAAAQLRALVRLLSYSSGTVALLPAMLHEAHEGDYAPLANQTSTTLRRLPESLSFPMSNAVVCTEDAPFAPAGSREGLDATYLGTTIVDALAEICAKWPAGAIDADLKMPLV